MSLFMKPFFWKAWEMGFSSSWKLIPPLFASPLLCVFHDTLLRLPCDCFGFPLKEVHSSEQIYSLFNQSVNWKTHQKAYYNNVWLLWEFYRPCTLWDYIFLLFSLGERRKTNLWAKVPSHFTEQKEKNIFVSQSIALCAGYFFPRLILFWCMPSTAATRTTQLPCLQGRS